MSHNLYKASITDYYLSLIDKDPLTRTRCPIYLQAVPNDLEIDPELPDWAKAWSQEIYSRDSPWSTDPIGDLTHLEEDRLTHRYHNRALVHVSATCATYCRFCFRKEHLNDLEKKLYSQGGLNKAFEYIKNNPSITEVILTGGDPLSLSDSSLEKVVLSLNEITSIKTLRIHTRMPVTQPSRISKDLVSTLNKFNNHIYIVSHFNHPKEITFLALERLKLLQKNGISTLNQSVLLRHINNKEETLFNLFQKLYENGVPTFHLHHPDWVSGSFGFRTSIQNGLLIYNELKGRLSGPALPDYVLDLPGGLGKSSLDSLDPKETLVLKQHTDCPTGIEGTLYNFRVSKTRKNFKSMRVPYIDLSYRENI